MSDIKQLRELPLREHFDNEEYDFTPWLQEHLDLLSANNLLEFQLENAELEESVGSYKADIVATGVTNDRTVVIENQFNSTDHKHLGQLLLYAAGKEADVVVWIAEEFTPEHTRALEMLNQRADDELSLFGFEIGLKQIGDSPYAIDFTPIVRPDYWSPVQTEEELTDTELNQLQFWESFRSHLRDQNLANFATRAAGSRPAYGIRFGFSEAYIRPTARFQDGHLLCYVRVTDPEGHFAGLEEDQFRSRVRDVAASMDTQEILPDIADELEWNPTQDAKYDKIRLDYGSADFEKQKNWPEYHQWLSETAEVFKEVLTEQLQ